MSMFKVIFNSSFTPLISNGAKCLIENSEFRNLKGNLGGANLIINSNLTVLNSIYKNCSAIKGGAIYLECP